MTKFIQACGIAVSIALAACGGGVDDVKSAAKEACACKDKACAEAANAKLEKALRSITSEEDAKKVIEPMFQAAACLAKLGIDAK